MTAKTREITATIRTLTDLAAREARALKRRDLSEIAQIAERKQALAAQLEAALPSHEMLGAEAQRDLARLRAVSTENATRLASLHDSIARARSRLESLVASERSSGVYGAHGKGRLASKPGSGRDA